MATYIDTPVPYDDDLDVAIEDDLPRGPRAGSLGRAFTTIIAVILAVGLAVAAAAMAYTVGKAQSAPPVSKVNADKIAAEAHAAGVAAGQKAGFATGYKQGLAKGSNSAALTSYKRGLRRGRKTGYAQGVRDGRRRGFSDGANSVSQQYQATISTLTASLDQAQKDAQAAAKKATAAQKAAKGAPPPAKPGG
jgi:hypothetical protein